MEGAELGGSKPQASAGIAEPAQPDLVGVAVGARQVDEFTVAERVQVLDGVPGGLVGIREHGRDPVEQAIGHHDRGDPGEPEQGAIRHLRREQQQPIHLCGHGARPLFFVLRDLVGPGNEQGVAVATRLLLDGLGDDGGEGVGDVRDDDADVPRPLLRQRASDRMGRVTQLVRNCDDTTPRVRGDGAGTGEHAGHSRRRHTGACSDLSDGHAPPRLRTPV
jgi:hypothetical protein